MDGKITISASTLDEAITKALIELQTTSEHLHYEVVQKESAGLLGIFGKKPCIIRAHVMSEAEEKAAAEAQKIEEKDLILLRFARRCFDEGPRAVQMLGDPDVHAAFVLERNVNNEVCRFIEFIRFEEKDGMLGSVIHPKNNVLPLLRGHFCSRLPDEDFLIFDAAHGTALLRQSGHVQYLAMEHYEPARDADELNWQALWKRFFHALTIEERRNAKAQMNHAPKRFWGGMVEMREPYI